MKSNPVHPPPPLRFMEKKEFSYAVFLMLVLAASLFIHLGEAPLKHEEPRRGLIALEMLFRGNWIVPTEMGELYYNKPPVYNWVLILAFKLFGDYSEFAVRFFSVLSFLGMGCLIWLTGRRYLNPTFGMYSALLFLVSADILYYFSLTGEIDLFYSLLTFGSMLAIFHYYQRGKMYHLFIVTYLLSALGALTKGLPSIAFAGISLLAFFIYQKDLKKLIHPAHFAGIGIFLLLTGGYFWIYSQYQDPAGFLTRLYSESSQRTAVENSLGKLLQHLLVFPVDTLKNIAPASLLLIFAIRRDFFAWLKQPLIRFAIIIFLANILLYWFSPGTRSRYVYMLYPFPVMILAYFYLLNDHAPARRKIFHRVVLTLLMIIMVCCIALPFIPRLQPFVPHLGWVAVAGALGALALLYIHISQPNLGLLNLIAAAVLVRLVFDFTVIPVRANSGNEYQDKLDAQAITDLTQERPLYILEGAMLSRTTVFYIERDRQKVLSFMETVQPNTCYIAYENQLKGKNYLPLYEFQYEGETLKLVQFNTDTP